MTCFKKESKIRGKKVDENLKQKRRKSRKLI